MRKQKRELPKDWYELDVSRVATQGHVNTARMAYLSRVLSLPLLLAGTVIGYHIVVSAVEPFAPELASAAPHLSLSFRIDPTPPAAIMSALNVDSKRYYDLGGGLSGDAGLRWMANYTPRPESLSLDDLSRLSGALKTDLAQYGRNVDKWQHIKALPVAPQIAQPSQAIKEYGERLRTGIVIVMPNSDVVPVVSHTAGEWSVLLFKGNACRVALGPLIDGCSDYRGKSEIATEARAVLKIVDPSKG
ncbi:hypothetical protein [Rhizobium leguminosarum]|uniref:hypothetical protein n=1 Tax=Rhizobium leguminosarum TaxID=384 RepID=UPI0013EF1995|nr:hypothetical protein [Rhizobium leguminosarum]